MPNVRTSYVDIYTNLPTTRIESRDYRNYRVEFSYANNKREQWIAVPFIFCVLWLNSTIRELVCKGNINN